MKKLNIKSGNCLLKVSNYDTKINDTGLEELVRNNLPELKNYKNYPIKLNLSIEFLGEEKLEIIPTGYEIKENEDNESEED